MRGPLFLWIVLFAGFMAAEGWASGTFVAIPAPSSAPHLVIVTDGSRTVTSVRPDEHDQRGEFLMIIPLEKAAGVPEVSTLPAAAFTELHHMSAPQLRELWECDPCDARSCDASPLPLQDRQVPSGWKATESKPVGARARHFGGYEVAFVRGITGLRRWLEQQSLASVLNRDLDRYAGPSWSFLVARRAPTSSRADTHPGLRVSYQSDSVELPWLLPRDEQGRAELLLHVVAPERQEVHGVRMIRGSSGSEVGVEVSGHFAEFYDQQIESLLDVEGVLVEFTGHARARRELVAFGVDLVFPRRRARVGRVLLGPKLARSDSGHRVASHLQTCDRAPREQSVTLRLEPGDDGNLHVSVVRGKPTTEFVDCVRDRGRRAMRGLEADTVTFDFARAADGTLLQRELEQHVPLVLTRMRARFGGPREHPLRLRANPGSGFQAVYTVRHPWRGEAACASPEFGRWGYRLPEGIYDTEPASTAGAAAESSTSPELAADSGATDSEAAARADTADAHSTRGRFPTPIVIGVLSLLVAIPLVWGLIKRVRLRGRR